MEAVGVALERHPHTPAARREGRKEIGMARPEDGRGAGAPTEGAAGRPPEGGTAGAGAPAAPPRRAGDGEGGRAGAGAPAESARAQGGREGGTPGAGAPGAGPRLPRAAKNVPTERRDIQPGVTPPALPPAPLASPGSRRAEDQEGGSEPPEADAAGGGQEATEEPDAAPEAGAERFAAGESAGRPVAVGGDVIDESAAPAALRTATPASGGGQVGYWPHPVIPTEEAYPFDDEYQFDIMIAAMERIVEGKKPFGDFVMPRRELPEGGKKGKRGQDAGAKTTSHPGADDGLWPSGPIVGTDQLSRAEVEHIMDTILTDAEIMRHPSMKGLSRLRLKEVGKRAGFKSDRFGRFSAHLLVWFAKAGVTIKPDDTWKGEWDGPRPLVTDEKGEIRRMLRRVDVPSKDDVKAALPDLDASAA